MSSYLLQIVIGIAGETGKTYPNMETGKVTLHNRPSVPADLHVNNSCWRTPCWQWEFGGFVQGVARPGKMPGANHGMLQALKLSTSALTAPPPPPPPPPHTHTHTLFNQLPACGSSSPQLDHDGLRWGKWDVYSSILSVSRFPRKGYSCFKYNVSILWLYGGRFPFFFFFFFFFLYVACCGCF